MRGCRGGHDGLDGRVRWHSVVKGNVRTVTLVVIGAVALIIAGWTVTLVLFKAGETTNPPRTLTVTTTEKG